MPISNGSCSHIDMDESGPSLLFVRHFLSLLFVRRFPYIGVQMMIIWMVYLEFHPSIDLSSFFTSIIVGRTFVLLIKHLNLIINRVDNLSLKRTPNEVEF